jgi:peptidoglycan/xylan/chitin deacetylase (PgdA/CDA1 family)
VPILMYHDLGPEPSPITLPVEAFARQMRWLHEHGATVLSLDELAAAMTGLRDLPERPAVLTFDDGFESVYTSALPELARYGFRASVFAVSGHCGKTNDWPGQPAAIPRRPLMTWPQIRELSRYGVEVGGHTRSHPRLDRLSRAEVDEEIRQDRQEIEQRLGCAVRHFAYPYGRVSSDARKAVAEAYVTACSTELALATAASDLLALERIDACYLQTPLALRALWSPPFGGYLSLRRALRRTASVLLRREWT